MTEIIPFNYPNYLAAKKLIDDRSLNQQVFNTLKCNVSGQLPESPLKILEIGAGIGTMVERLIDWDLLRYSEYTAVDIDVQNLQYLPRRLSEFARNQDIHCKWTGRNSTEHLVLEREDLQVSVQIIHRDFREYISGWPGEGSWDVIIAHAVLDILPLEASLGPLLRKLHPGTLLYFTLNYNGVTQFEPAVSPSLDRQIEQIYNQSMDQRPGGTGGSRTGSKLLDILPSLGAEIIASGPSDWLVQAGNGGFSPGERYFLRCILDMVYQSVQSGNTLPAERTDPWYHKRLRQIQNNTLIYRAHQLDICAKLS